MVKTKPQLFMSTVRIGPKGQIVIPKEIRDMLGVGPGDSLLLMADSRRGVALQKQSVMNGIAQAIFSGQGAALYPGEPEEHLRAFAENIDAAAHDGEEQLRAFAEGIEAAPHDGEVEK